MFHSPVVSLLRKHLPQIVCFFAGGVIVALLLANWQGLIRLLLFAGGAALILLYLWHRGKAIRNRLRQAVHRPLKLAQENQGKLGLLGVASVSLVGLYAVLGGDESAYAAIEQSGLASLDVAQQEVPGEVVDSILDEQSGLAIDELAASSLAYQQDVNDEVEAIESPSFSGVIPISVLLGAIRSLWANGKQYLAGEIPLGQGLRNTGVDILCAAGRGAIFVGGTNLAGMLVATASGTYPLIVASGLLCNLASEPLVARVQTILKGRSVPESLTRLGKQFAEQECLARAWQNIDNLITEGKQEVQAISEPVWGIREAFWPTYRQVLAEEHYHMKRQQLARSTEYAEKLKDKLTDALISKDYRVLGELVYLNRSFLLLGYYQSLQQGIAQVDSALLRLGSKDLGVAR